MQNMDINAFTRTAARLRSERIAQSSRRRHAIVKGNGVSAVLIASHNENSKKYSDLAERARTYKHIFLKDIFKEIGMEIVDVFLWTVAQPEVQSAIEKDMSIDGSPIQKALSRRSISIPLPTKHSSALLLSQNATESKVQFLRNYSSGNPSLHKFRAEKKSYILNMPDLQILRQESNEWELVESVKMRDNIKNPREILCVRMKLKDAVVAKLAECKSTDNWPTPPESRTIPIENVNATVVLLLSIDSGAGTVKLMGKFLRIIGNQSVNEVFLIAQAVGKIESFTFFERIFGDYKTEIDDIVNAGVYIDDVHIRIIVLHVHDFKVMYILTGSKGANSRYPCCHCSTPRQLMEKSYGDLMQMTANIPMRPNILDLRGKKDTLYQYANTYNILSIYPKRGEQNYSNLVIPVLHIQLGIFNKLIAVLDLVVAEWEKLHNWNLSTKSPGRMHLYTSLSKVRAHREKYFSGELAGDSGRSFISRMEVFCETFFCSNPHGWASLLETMPEITALKTGLQEIALLYNGNHEFSGLGYYLNHQKVWTPSMIHEWKTVSQMFVQKLVDVIGRPAMNSVHYASFPKKEPWRTPLSMPKLHAMSIHAHEVIEDFNVLGSMAEQATEHKHKVSSKNRNTFSPNQCQGQQIVEDMRNSWVQTSSILKNVLKEAELRRIEQGKVIKKPRFS